MVDVLAKIVGEENLFLNEPMSLHTTFGIGGNAQVYATPTSNLDLLDLIAELEKLSVKWKVVGNGSNLLFMDDGYDGVIIGSAKLNEVCDLGNGKVIASSGVKLSALALDMANSGWSGLEFASGIPATIGGAIFMNAGAFGKSISDVLHTVSYFNGRRIVEAYAKELNFSYRHSIFQNNSNFVILYCELNLKASSSEFALGKIKSFQQLRQDKQPIGKSAGSVFKSIEQLPAGKLIEECGLKDLKVGGAVVSSKHANFILNEDNATAEDVIKLIDIIKYKVNEKYNKLLELEIEIVR